MTRGWRSSTEFGLLGICFVGVIGLAVLSDGNFLSANSIRVFLYFLAVPVLIGLAQMVVLAVGELNLAVGAMGGMSAVATGLLMTEVGLPALLAIVAGFLLATLTGLVNGVLIVLTRINGFIVTLATFTILTGVQYRLIGTRAVSDYSPRLRDLGRGTIADRVPLIFLVACVVALLVSFYLHRAKAGRAMLATGGNAHAARLSGISNDRSLVLAHTLSGAIVGVAAVVTVASAPVLNKSIGADWLLPSFAAPIIGGALLTGGSVVVLGTVLAAFIVRLVDSYRAELGWKTSVVSFAVGAVVLGTVIFSRARETRRRRALEAHPRHDVEKMEQVS